MSKRVGIITYHSAYNFGSVLQAYATQQTIAQLGHEPFIINYRMKSQYEYYETIHVRQGIKRLLRDLLFIPVLRKYKLRKQRYETFISNMNLTNEVSEPEEMMQFAECFDLYISGSDQIWNKHSNELKEVEWKYMLPYLLDFTTKEKISYASSVVTMRKNELEYISKYIKKFSNVSCRESDSSQRISTMIENKCETVVDPTLLVDKVQWEQLLAESSKQLKQEKYIVYYALEGIKKTFVAIPHLKKIAKKMKCKLVVITPLAPVVNCVGIINAVDAGPMEFLRLVHDAELVITNSYHGTLFSVNLNKNFFSLRECNSVDDRIPNILRKLGLEERIIYSFDDIDIEKYNINYESAINVLMQERKKSIEYLKRVCCAHI